MNLDADTRIRLFDPRPALHEPFVVGVVLAVVIALTLLPLVALMTRGKTRADLFARWRGWLMLAPLMLVPVILGAIWVFAATFALALFCYREFARATGLFRSRFVSAAVVVGMTLTYFAAADHYYNFFVALWPLSVGLIALAGLAADRPQGYLQRVALGVLAFMLFGAGLGHLAYFANDLRFRPILLWIVLCVELNDVFAYTCGKLLGPLTGGTKLLPNTSPNKTLAGALGAVALTTLTAVLLGRLAWAGEEPSAWGHLVALGLLISTLGQAGDLLLSAVKRDLGLKDFGTAFPGHGGLLDRFDSLLLVAPAVFHYVGYLRGLGLDQPERIFSATWF